MPEYEIERRDGNRYTVTVRPGQLVSLRPDESIVIPAPPSTTASLTLATLERLEQRIATLERKMDNLLTSLSGRVWSASSRDDDRRDEHP